MPEIFTDEDVGLAAPAPKPLSDAEVGLEAAPSTKVSTPAEPSFSPSQYVQQGTRSLIQGVTEAAASIPEAIAIPAAYLERKFGNLGPGNEGKLEEQGTYKLGQAIRTAGDFYQPKAVPGLEESFVATKIPSGIGSTFPMMAGGLAGQALKLPALVIPALMGFAQNAVSGYEDSESKGATDEQKLASYGLNGIVGLSEAAPLGRIFKFLDDASGHTFKTVIKHSLKEGAEEALQEAFQSGAGDAIAKWFVKYDPDRVMFQQLVDNAAVGGIVGTTLGLITGGIGAKLTGMARQDRLNQIKDYRAQRADFRAQQEAAVKTQFDSLMADIRGLAQPEPSAGTVERRAALQGFYENPPPSDDSGGTPATPLAPVAPAPAPVVAPPVAESAPAPAAAAPVVPQVAALVPAPAPSAPNATEPSVREVQVGDTVTAKSHQITGLVHTGKVVSINGDEIGMVNQEGAPVLVLRKNVESAAPAAPQPSPVAATAPVSAATLPTRASDNSVRDHTISGTRKGDVITMSTKGGPKFTFSAAQIADLTEWDRSKFIEKQTAHWDDEPGGAGQAARLRDSVRAVMRKLVAPKPSLQDRIDANRAAQGVPPVPPPAPQPPTPSLLRRQPQGGKLRRGRTKTEIQRMVAEDQAAVANGAQPEAPAPVKQYVYKSPNRPVMSISQALPKGRDGWTLIDERTFSTPNPLPPQLVSNLELQEVKEKTKKERQDEFLAENKRREKEKEESIATVLAAAGDSGGVELVSKTRPNKKLLVTPEPGQAPKWRVTSVDEHGPSGHHVFDSREAAIRAAAGDSYSKQVAGPSYHHLGEFEVARVMQPAKVQAAPPRTGSKAAWHLRPRRDGITDILDDIQELGGIRTPREGDGGEYDGFKEAMQGPARVLARKDGGRSVDKIILELTSKGYHFEKTDDFWDAVKAASRERDKLKFSRTQEEMQTDFHNAALSNKGKSVVQKGTGTVNTDELAKGDEIKVKGAWVKVISIDPDDGTVTVQDTGTQFGTQELPAGSTVHLDRGTSVKRAERDATSFLPPEDEAALEQERKAAEQKPEPPKEQPPVAQGPKPLPSGVIDQLLSSGHEVVPAGPGAANFRQVLMFLLTGKKTPLAKSGVNAVVAELAKYLGVEDNHRAGVDDAIRDKLREMQAPATQQPAPPPVAKPEELTPEQMINQRQRYWLGIKRGQIEVDDDSRVTVQASDAYPGRFDVWQTKDGQRKMVSNPAQPMRMQEAQNHAVNFALKQGGTPPPVAQQPASRSLTPKEQQEFLELTQQRRTAEGLSPEQTVRYDQLNALAGQMNLMDVAAAPTEQQLAALTQKLDLLKAQQRKALLRRSSGEGSDEQNEADIRAYQGEIDRVQRQIDSATPQQREEQRPLFQAAPRAGGLPAGQIEQFLASHTERTAVPVVIVQSVTELPQRVQESIAQDVSGGDASLVRAVIFQDQIYFVADNIGSVADIPGILAHELVGHYGVDDVIGSELQSFMEGVTDSYENDPLRTEVERLYIQGRRAVTPQDKLLVGREIVARLAEDPSLNPSLWQRLVAWVQNWLRKLGLKLRVTEADIRAAILEARERVKRPQAPKPPMNMALFKLGDPENVEQAKDLLRNPTAEEKPLIDAMILRPNDALYGHVLPSFQALSQAAKNRLPEMQARGAMMQEFGNPNDPRPLREQLDEQFPNQPEYVQQGMASAFSNAERFRATGQVVSDQLNQSIDNLQRQLRIRERLERDTVRAKAARGLAAQMIEQKQNEVDQRIASERNETEKAVLQNTRKLLNEFLPLERMGSIITAAARMTPIGIKELAADIKALDSTVASIKAKYKIFDGVGDDVAEQALGVMKLNQALYDQLITAKNASNPKLAADIMKLDQAVIAGKVDVAEFAKKYAEVRQISTDHAKLLEAVNRDLRNAFREYLALAAANDFVQQTMGTPQFQRNWSDATKALGAQTVIKDDNGLSVTYQNPNVQTPETVTIPTALDHKTAVQNSSKLALLGGWMEQYLEEGTDPVLKESYRKELEFINQYLRNPEVDPRTGNRLTRGQFDPTRLFSGFGRISTPDTVGRYLGGELGMRVRQAVRNFSEARARVMSLFPELSQDVQRKSLKAATGHGMTVDEWTRRVAEPILQSYMAVGDRHLDVEDSLPGGIIVTQADMASVAAQARFIQRIMGDIQKLPQELASFLFAPSKIVETPTQKGGRVILRNPIPLTKYGVPRVISSVGYEVAENWQKVKKDFKGDTKQETEELVKLVNDPKYRDIFLSYFRTFTDPSFIVKSPLREAALEVNRDINIGDVPANFDDMVTRLQDKLAHQATPVLLSRAQVQGLLLKDLSQVMAAVASDMQERDVSANASETNIISADNFMNRPRGDTIALKGMYDLALVNIGQQMQKAAAVTEVYGQAMLNSWRAALEALRTKKNEMEARVKGGEAREDVNADTEAAMKRGDEFYKLSELDELMSQLERNIDQAKSMERNQASFEQQMMAPRALRLIKGYVLSGLLQRVTVMGNNFFGGVNKMNQMDALLDMTKPVLGIQSPLVKLPVSAILNTSRAVRNLVRVVRDGISASALETAWGKKTLADMEAHPELYRGFAGNMLRNMVKWSRRYEEAERLGLYNFAPFWSQLQTRLELRKIGGEIRGNNPTAWTRQFDKLANILEIAFETGIFLGRAPSAWLPGVVDAAINVTAHEKTREMLGVLQVNALKAFRNRVAMGQDPNTISLTPQEWLGKPADANINKEFSHLQTMFTENNLNLDQLARDYYRNVRAAGPDAGQVWLTDKLGINGLTSTVANEMNRASFANRPQNMAHDSWGKFFMNLLGYGFNENAKLGLLWAKAARNPKKLAELHTAMRYILPMMLSVLALGTLVAAPLLDKLLELWEGKKRARPQLSDAESATDLLKVVGYAAGPMLPMIGQFVNNAVQPDAPGRGIFGSNLQLLPLSLANSFLQFIKQVKDTGEFVRPAVQFNAQWNPSSNVAVNRLPMMQGWLQMQNDIAVQRRTTPATIELKKQSGGAPAQYSPVWGMYQDIKNELGKQEPDYAKITELRAAGIEKLRAAGHADPEKSFDRGLLASANKYLTIYGRELTQGEKDRIDAKKTPEERAESDRIDAAVQGYAARYGEPIPDFIRQTKDERAQNKALGIPSNRSQTAATGSGTSPSSLGLSSGSVGGGRATGGGRSGGGGTSIRSGGLRRVGSRGYGLRRIKGSRPIKVRGLRAPRRQSFKLRRAA